MLWCLVTANQTEIESGDLDSFLDSVADSWVQAVVVLREVLDADADRYASLSQVRSVVRAPECGLSEARNRALEALKTIDVSDNDYVAFPDDDCRYGSDFIQAFENILTLHETPDLVFGSYGEGGAQKSQPKAASAFDALLRVSSVGIFVQYRILKGVGGFNEALGVGSYGFQYGEDNDMAFRLFKRSRSALYAPALEVWHLEDREMVGRNSKGYLTVCALHMWSFAPAVLVARGLISALVHDALAGNAALPQSTSAARALSPRLLSIAFRQNRNIRATSLR